MSNYAVFFDYNNATYRLPVNPEQIGISTAQANEKYEILKLGQIAVPSHMELREYSFECEFPKDPLHYIEILNEFKESSFYLNLFRQWRVELKPIRFIASNNARDEINTLVLIEEMEVVEKSGEEGDKYVSFKLLEYKEYGKKLQVIEQISPNNIVQVASTKPVAIQGNNPKSSGSHTVVSGDTLWAISKKYYGDGAKYTKIYNVNKDKVKNPNLIYPGQVLMIP